MHIADPGFGVFPNGYFLQSADPFSGAYVFLGHSMYLLLPEGE